MKQYRRTNRLIEAASLLLILFQTCIFYIIETITITILVTSISFFVYLIISVAMFYSISPKIILKEPENPELFGTRFSIGDEEKYSLIKTGVFFVSAFKFSMLLIPVFMLTSDKLFSTEIYIHLAVIVIILFTALLILAFAMQCFLKAKGFSGITIKRVLLTTIFYYNPDDKRSIVNKQLGIGSTINLASKEGRIILGMIIAIPLTIVLVLLIVFSV